MAEFLIPNYKMEELEKKINRIRNKGANITFNIINEHEAVDVPELGEDAIMDCSRVDIEGRYEINGWKFVATIEHLSPENIIRLADYSFDGRIPERYRTAGRECEHCHIRRDRNDTYLIYNEDEDEFKQVGRTCLKGYTNGLDAETCALFASVMVEVDRLTSGFYDKDYGVFGDSFRDYLSYSMKTARKKAYAYVKNNGYKPGDTSRDFNIDLYDKNKTLQQATDEEVKQVTDWLESVPTNGYIANARAAWNKTSYELRDSGLITSAISSYFKAREKEQAEKAALADKDNSFAGEIGDKVELTVKEVRVIYWRTAGFRGTYNEHQYPVYRMVGEDNKVYIWGSSTNEEVGVGDKLKGTVKNQITRPNGELQTELTRCKIIFSKQDEYKKHVDEIKKQAKQIKLAGDQRSYFDIVNDLLDAED